MTIKVRFDGKTFVPDKPVDLPADQWYEFELSQKRAAEMIVPPKRTDLATASWEELGIGGWAHRTDIDDDFARRLREKVQKPRYTLRSQPDDSAR